MSKIKGEKVVYSGLKAGEMVSMNSDSEAGDTDLTEELVNLDLDSDWEGEDGDEQNSKENNSECDQEEIVCLSSQQKHLKLCIRKCL